MRRSLIFHCFPAIQRDWQKVCLSTFRYRHIFDGRVLISITTGPECEKPEVVAGWFQKFWAGLEITLVPNCAAKGINTTFREQVKAVRNEEGIVFKAHTKGISHGPLDPHGKWRENMAHGCLDDMDFVEQKFRDGFRTFGAYRTVSAMGSRIVNLNETRWPGWHYPGAFFWFDPKAVPESWFHSIMHHYENEEFPCVLGPIETGFCPTPDNTPFEK